MKSCYNMQDQFLNCARKEKNPVTVFLQNGVSLKGYVKGFDVFTLILEQPGKPWVMVYKHSIISIVPKEPISIAEQECCSEEKSEEKCEEKCEDKGGE
ncbi:MAG: RNA chaperone Hfq [Abditibacteriota bacterium]|nr:RNA chaperone Hfq [Abditibacteriota bacterium]